MSSSFNSLTDELIAAYAELRRFLARRLGNAEDAADVAQSSFERAYKYVLSVPVASPRALLFRTAQNVCIDQSRRRQMEARVLATYSATTTTASPSTERVVSEREAIARIAAHLARLPRKRREVFTLVRVYGYTHAEVAEHMGLTIPAIEKHVVRATLDCSDLFVALNAGLGA